MKQRWLHISLSILVLAQPVASGAVWASMQESDPVAAAVDVPMKEVMTGCHDAGPVETAAVMADAGQAKTGTPGCCDSLNCSNCGMDCGAAGSAIHQTSTPQAIPGQGVYCSAAIYAAPSHSPTPLFKPPRTS